MSSNLCLVVYVNVCKFVLEANVLLWEYTMADRNIPKTSVEVFHSYVASLFNKILFFFIVVLPEILI